MRVEVVNLDYDKRRLNARDKHMTEKEFDFEENHGLYTCYEFIQECLRYSNSGYGLLDDLNRLQSLGNVEYGSNGVWQDRNREDDIWRTKGVIPYEVVNMLIKPYGLMIREKKDK